MKGRLFDSPLRKTKIVRLIVSEIGAMILVVWGGMEAADSRERFVNRCSPTELTIPQPSIGSEITPLIYT